MQDIDPTLKARGIALGVVVVALALVDLVVLKGDPVASGTLSLRPDSEPFAVMVTQPAEEHLLEIRTRKRVRGESRGLSIAYRLVDPDGVTLLEESELVTRKKRYVSFQPTSAGEYTLHAEEARLIGSGGRGTAYVAVTVGDHRVISRLLGF